MIAGLRHTERPETFQRIRMLDYFMELPICEAYDVVAHVPQTRCADPVEELR
ncbi:hypothetical protein [Spongiactinospora sp. TRM90649]|uniref:hypothetical protein n=1 Tax=Spongiactinospora sp. TRM90649 TaxID=3031114 RepID=UPI0023F9B413|nr:hypothetical protein [Spongiactinospora sp. TRM90649]MDF5751008.1 hypothetical protein [Spongiactinospora sp. TRM90649]